MLPELLSRAAPAEGRLEALQDAVWGFTSKGAAHEEGAVQPDTYWEANRQLPTVDRRRWPPAVQALARQLCVEMAGAALAALSSRLAAVCQLVRLQVRREGSGVGRLSRALCTSVHGLCGCRLQALSW